MASPSGRGFDIQTLRKETRYFSGPKRGWFFICDKVSKPTSERKYYTEKDIEVLTAEFVDFCWLAWPWSSMSGRLCLAKDVGRRPDETPGRNGNLSTRESLEDCAPGRICHRFTTDLGFSNGGQDIVVVRNRLTGYSA